MMGNQNQNYGENEGEDRNRLNPNQQQQNQPTDDDDLNDGGADLYETDVIPGSEDVIDDLELDPDDDPNTNVDKDDLDALEGMDRDDDDRL